MRRRLFIVLLLCLPIFGHCHTHLSEVLELAKLRQLDKAQKVLNQLKLQSSKDFEGQLHLLQGVIYLELYQFNESLKELGEAREILESQSSSEYLGHCYFYLARLYKDGFTNSEHARTLLNKAIVIYNELPDQRFNIASANFQMARTYPFSDLDKRAYFNGLAMLFFESDAKLYAFELAECYNLNALLLFFENRNSEIWKSEFGKAISLAKTLEHRQQINLGKYYDNLGFCLSAVGSTKALSLLEEGLSINKKFEFNGYWVTSSLNNIGSHYERIGKPDLSLKLYKEVVALRRKIFGETSPEVIFGFEHIANTFIKLGQMDSARFYFDLAIKTYRNRVNSSDLNLSSQYSLSYAFLLKRRADEYHKEFELSRSRESLILAIEYLMEASKIIENNYNSLELESSKIAYLADVRSLFLKRIEIDQILFEQTGSERFVLDGLESMEFLRYASTFQSQIRVRDSYSQPELKELISHQLQLKSELILLNGIKSGDNVKKRKLELANQLFTLSDSVNKLLNFNKNQAIDYKKILQSKIKDGSALLEYQDSGNGFYLILVTETKNSFVKITKPDDWEAQLKEFFRIVSQVPTAKNFDSDFKSFVNSSHFLYKTLLKPVQNLLSNNSRIIVIPDAQINNLPFEALVTSIDSATSYSNLKFLFKQYDIENSLSLRLYATDKEERKTIDKVLAFGYTEGPSLIPGAERELTSITRNFNAITRTGSMSSSQYFINEAPDFPLIHLAIHGEADETNLLKSRLIFSERDTLFSHQLYSIRLNSPLVVLSSCETAIGQLHQGEGIFSIGRAFVMAGASSLIVTSWKTPDNSTTKILGEFYDLLSEGRNSSSSIQLAKLNYLAMADKFNAHPFFWAGIRPVGSVNKTISSEYYYMTALFFSIVICVYWIVRKRILFKKTILE